MSKKEKAMRVQEQIELDFVLTLINSQIFHKDTHDDFTTAFIKLNAKHCIKILQFVVTKKMEMMIHNHKVLFVCPNVVVYNKFWNKKIISCGHDFENFNAYMRSIEVVDKPSKEGFAKLGHVDINTAKTNTLETLTISFAIAKYESLFSHKFTPNWKDELRF